MQAPASPFLPPLPGDPKAGHVAPQGGATGKVISLAGKVRQSDEERSRTLKTLWDKSRPQHESRAACLESMRYTLEAYRERVSPDAPHVTLDMLIAAERDGGWEEEYQRGLVGRVLENALLSPVEKLRTILGAVEQAEDDYRRAHAEYARTAGASGATFGDDQVRIARDRARAAYARWYELQEHARKAEEDVRRREIESIRTVRVQQERESIASRLREQYGDLGAQYDMLIHRLASLEVRLRQIETSGRDVSTAEYAELHRQHLAYTNQLQKYTESLKSESITRQTQETVLAVLALVERLVAPSNPTLWNEIVKAVKAQVETGSTDAIGNAGDMTEAPALPLTETDADVSETGVISGTGEGA